MHQLQYNNKHLIRQKYTISSTLLQMNNIEYSSTKSQAKQQDQNPQIRQLLNNQSNLPKQTQQSVSFLQQSIFQNIFSLSQRFYKKSTWASSIIQNCIEIQSQSISIELHYGPLATKINVINLNIPYQENYENFLNSGSFGHVQKFYSGDQSIALKFVHVDENKQSFSHIQNLYKEYFIGLLASQLGVGPKIIDVFGYQIIFLKNFAVFAMQLCENVDYKGFRSTKRDIFKKQIQKSLQTLHSFHVVHRDIKPQNILWSPTYQKHVLIDFGLSQIVRQKPGQKTLTSYSGSFIYCSSQMQKCLLLKCSRYVDLYNNDLYAFQKLIDTLKSFIDQPKLLKRNSQKNNLNDQHFLSCLVQVANIKNSLFKKKMQDVYIRLINCKYSLRTSLHIYNKVFQQYNLQQQKKKLLIEWKKQTRELVIKEIQTNSKVCQADVVFQRLFQQQNSQNYFPYLLSLSSSIQNQLQNLNKWINDQMWLSRIFFILFPSEDSPGPKTLSLRIFRLIINSMYSFLENEPTDIFVKKIRRVLLYFSKKFSELRKKQLLQSLSDIFILIGNYIQAIRIRNYIVTIIINPLEYCFRNLLYFMLDQVNFAFLQGPSINYLLNIKKIINQSSKPSSICIYSSILLQIVEKFMVCSPSTVMKYHYLQNIIKLFQKLQQRVLQSNPEFAGIIERVIIRFKNNFLPFIYADIYNPNNLYTSKDKIQFKRKIDELKKKTKKQQHYSFISKKIHYKFLKQQLKNEYQMFLKVKDQSLIEQYLQFCFQLNQDKRRLTHKMLFWILRKKFQDDLSIVTIAIKKRIKWIKLFQKAERKYQLQQLFFQILGIIKNIQFLYQNIDKQVKLHTIDQKFIDDVLIILQQTVRKAISCSQKKDQFLLFIKIISLVRFNYSNSEQKTLSAINQIYSSIKNWDMKEQLRINYLVRSYLLESLALIYKLNSFKRLENISRLQDYILLIFQIKLDDFNAINLFELFLKLNRKKGNYQGDYDLTLKLTIYLFIQQKILQHHCDLAQKFYRGIDFLVENHWWQQTQQKILQFDSQKGHFFQQAIKNIHGCYYILKMLQKCNKKIPIITKYLYKIAFCISKSRKYENRSEILKSYFHFFISKNLKNERKLLICQRLQYKHSCSFANLNYKMAHSKKQILKKSQKWPQFAEIIIQKLNIYLNCK